MEIRTEAPAAARLDELLLKTSRTFALSIPVLPEPTRREVTVAYLLFRVADTLEDATLWSAGHQVEQLERLSGLLAGSAGEQAAELAELWQGECTQCGQLGPSGETQREGVELWNVMSYYWPYR